MRVFTIRVALVIGCILAFGNAPTSAEQTAGAQEEVFPGENREYKGNVMIALALSGEGFAQRHSRMALCTS